MRCDPPALNPTEPQLLAYLHSCASAVWCYTCCSCCLPCVADYSIAGVHTAEATVACLFVDCRQIPYSSAMLGSASLLLLLLLLCYYATATMYCYYVLLLCTATIYCYYPTATILLLLSYCYYPTATMYCYYVLLLCYCDWRSERNLAAPVGS
jgi:hypothetical protein